MRYRDKVVDRAAARALAAEARAAGRRVVLTNGCFDLLHVGHVRYLARARSAGDLLIVAVNDDASVRRLKGAPRPLVPVEQRVELLAALVMVDHVVVFEADTPAELIAELEPDVLVKGGDWAPDAVVGREVVEARGGRVLIVPLTEGLSTSNLVTRIRGG